MKIQFVQNLHRLQMTRRITNINFILYRRYTKMEKARMEYQKYQIQNLSPVEAAYLQTIKEIEQTVKRRVGIRA